MTRIPSPQRARLETLGEVLRRRAAEEPARRAYTFLAEGEIEESHLTHEELDLRARAIAATLQNLAAPGDRALLCYNSGLEFAAAFWGCIYAGVVAVPVFPARLRRHLPRLQAVAADSQATLLLATVRMRSRAEELFRRVPELMALRWQTTDDIPAASTERWRRPDIRLDSLALLQYTSGSTNDPKGVMVTHGNLLHNSACIRRVCGFTQSDVGVTWLPHYHDMGLIGGLLQPLYAGYPAIILSPASFLQRPVRWLEAVTRFGATTIVAPNFAYDLCVRKITAAQRTSLRLDTIEVALSGAEPVRQETLAQFAEAFAPCGFRKEAFSPAYGLAEATLIVSGSKRGGALAKRSVAAAALSRNSVVASSEGLTGSRTLVGCGEALPEQKIVIADPESFEACPSGQVGEIWVSGPSVARGYWNRPKETDETFGAHLAGLRDRAPLARPDAAKGGLQNDNGPFLRTGDLGFVSEGQLFITGRLKDLIIIRGRNLYAHDLEQTVERSHRLLRPGCGAAFSIDGPGGEQLVIVHEVDDQAQAAWDEEVTAIRRALAESHEVQPHAVVLIEPRSIFRTTSGKIQRYVCREAFREGKLKVVHEWRAPVAVADGADRIANQARSSLVWDFLSTQNFAHRLAGKTNGHAPATRGRTRRPRPAEPIGEPVAITGMACRFPGAENLDALWELLRGGVDAIKEVPRDRWDVDLFYDPAPGTPGKMSTRWGGFLEGVDQFDPHFFGISPREAAVMDPQQRLLLEIAWEALENAGQAPDQLAGSKTGVFIGIGGFDYSNLMLTYEDHLKTLSAYTGTGNAHSIAANRISYLLDLRGPSVAIDTACSSSLVAIHLACQSLRSGQSDMALAGGVNLILSPEVTIAFSHAHMMAADGRCKPFDASADGYVRSEGGGIVVLKRLSDALRDRDNILALVRGSAVNQDGRTAGIAAPNGLAQQSVIREALAQAGVEPREVTYVEAHGTGTSIGDPIEVAAIQAVFGEASPGSAPCLVGSVKANIGHLENASGMAGLAKVILCLQHGEVPAQLHLKELNPRISFDGSRIEIARAPKSWPRANVRLAGVSSFGFGGTNAHAVVEESPLRKKSEKKTQRPAHLFTLSARTDGALKNLAARFAHFLAARPKERIADICFTANAGRSHFPQRLAVVCEDTKELQQRLANFSAGQPSDRLQIGHAVQKNGPRIAFLFAGQEALHSGNGAQLYKAHPAFRDAINRCAEFLRPHIEMPLPSMLFPSRRNSSTRSDALCTGPALFALEYALSELWRSWGIKPDAVLGRGVGEYVAAVVAGVFHPEDALGMLIYRDRLAQSLGNDSRTPMQDANFDAFETAAQAVHFESPRIVFISSLTATPLADGDAPGAVYWRRQIRHALQLRHGIRCLHALGFNQFLELGPDATLISAGRRYLDAEADCVWSSSLRRGSNEWQTLLESLGTLYVRGTCVDWESFDRPFLPSKVSLPTYPFERERCWLDPPNGDTKKQGQGTQINPLLGRRVRSALPMIQFESELSGESLRYLNDHRIQRLTVLPAAAYLEMALAASHEILGPGNHAVAGVAFQEALVLHDGRRKTVQLIAPPAAGGSTSFQIFGRDRDQENAGWTLHASGELHSGPAPAGPLTHDLAEIQNRCSELITGASHYASLKETGLEYGPAFQGVDRIWRREGESLGEVHLPAALSAGGSDYQIHPALLDSCLQVFAAAVAPKVSSADTKFLYLPSSMADFRLLDAPGERVFSHCVLRPGGSIGENCLEADICLLAEDGRAIAEISNFKVKMVAGQTERVPQESLDNLLYEPTWVPQVATPQPGNRDHLEIGEWVIFQDNNGIGAALAERIRASGGICALVPAENNYQIPDDSVTRGFVHLSYMDLLGTPESRCVLSDAQNAWLDALHFVQKLAKLPSRGGRRRLWMVTRGAQPVGPAPKNISVAQSALWGMARSVDLEHPELRYTRIDLDPDLTPDLAPDRTIDEAATLFEELSLQTAEDEVAFRAGIRHVGRLARRSAEVSTEKRLDIPEAPSYRMESLQPGNFENLVLRPAPRRTPEPGKVEIEVRAAGLNFRDVMNASGVYPGGPIPFGAECAGKISDLGPGVSEFRVGDDVIAIAPSSFSRFAITDARAVVPMPPAFCFEQAATIPITFLTAYYALHYLAKLSRGERVFIPAAAGGVGLAAVQLCQRAGAELYVTAGTPEKRAYLASLGIEHVLDSRSLAFADQVMEITGGRGVDVVLNSLPGEFAARSLAILGAYGRFVEIGKTDIYQNKQIGLFPFRNNLSYFGVDLDRVCRERPALVRSLFLELMEMFRDGSLQPLAHTVFPVCDAPDAFRYLARRKNIGKVVLSFNHSAPEDRGKARGRLRTDGTYLIAGGLGGLGLTLARWVVEQGVRHLALIGRNGPSEEAAHTIAALEARGTAVRVIRADIAEESEVSAALSEIRDSMPPLRGIIHSAGVLDDRIFLNLDDQSFLRVLAPKVQGTWNLHQLTATMPLDFFVVFSSAASVLGSPGQAHYAAANAFSDALVHHRRSIGLPAMAINWGPWAEIGMASRQPERRNDASRAIQPIAPAQGLAAFEQLLFSTAAQVAVIPVDWKELARYFDGRTVPTMVSDFMSKDCGPGTNGYGWSREMRFRREELLACDPPQQRAMLLAHVEKALAHVMALEVSELDPEEALFSFGLDSLMALELQHVLETSLDVRLPMETLMGTLTLNALVTRLHSGMAGSMGETAQESRQMAAGIRMQ